MGAQTKVEKKLEMLRVAGAIANYRLITNLDRAAVEVQPGDGLTGDDLRQFVVQMIGHDLEPDQISVVETVGSRSACSSNLDKGTLIIMTSGAFTAALFELVPRLELLTQKKRRIVIPATSVGTGDNSIRSRLKRGEIADVVIVAESLLHQFIEEGLVLAEGYSPVARSSIGMAVRAGALKPDISSVDALRTVLLEAKSIGYSASVSGQYLTTELYQRLGIADQVLPKSHLVGGGERVGAVVARGELEIGFQQISELLPVRGIDHITPLPAEVQRESVFSAGIGARSSDIALAHSAIQFLASRAAASAIIRSGLEVPAGR
jgi:molybdate transport system substrate-binding protein